MYDDQIVSDDVNQPEQRVDIIYLTRTYSLVLTYLEPFSVAVQPLFLLRSWRYPLISSLAFISLFALLLHPAFIPALFVLLASSASIFMLASYFTQCYTDNSELSRPKYQLNLNNSYQNDLTHELEQENDVHQDIKEFRAMLSSAQEHLKYIIKFFDALYNLLSWCDHFHSAVVVSILLVLVFFLVLFPSMTVSVIVTTCVCCDASILTRFISHITPEMKQKGKNSSVHPGSKVRSQTDVPISSGFLDLTDTPLPDNPPSGAVAPRRRLRHETCHKCETVLRIYRKKRQCQSCGNLFCSNCSVKIKKTFLGVTAPNAFKETVDVCIPCNRRLTSSPRLRPNRMVLQDSADTLLIANKAKKNFI